MLQAAAALEFDVVDAEETAIFAQIEELLKQDESYAAQNKKRQRLVREALQSPSFSAKLNLVDLLMEPLDAAINKFLQRSGILTQLWFDQQQLPEDNSKATTLFHEWASGHFGLKVVDSILHKIRCQDLVRFLRASKDPDLQQTCFEIVLFVLADIWRRCYHSVQTFPFQMFALLDCHDPATFAQKWNEAKDQLNKCPECFDVGFSAPLLRAVDFNNLSSDESRMAAMTDLQSLLHNVSSDAVEVSHGKYQNLFHRFRGGRKTAPTAAESSILHSLNQEHAALLRNVQWKTLPKKHSMAASVRNFKRRKDMKGRVLSRNQCLRHVAKKPIRKICGWNVFHRSCLNECGRSLSKTEYKVKTKAWSRQWRFMNEDDRQAFAVQERFEQACREELASRPQDSVAAICAGQEDLLEPMGSIDTFSTKHLQEVAGSLAIISRE